MFNEGGNYLENKKELINPVGGSNNTYFNSSFLKLIKINRKKEASRLRKEERLKKQKNSFKNLRKISDNFNELQQFFNSTFFNLAIPLNEENNKIEERRYLDASWDDRNNRKLIVEENKEEHQQIPPFEVTDSLKLALSSTKPTIERREDLLETLIKTKPLIEQEKLLNEEGLNNWINPWERQRGEDREGRNNNYFNIEQPNSISTFIFSSLTTTPPPSTPTKPFSFSIKQQTSISPPPPTHSIMPGAHFYVDQHVSRGRFGRKPPLAPTFVYDPNVLQSRYGFNGILSQFLPNGKLQRFGTGIVDHRQNGVALLQQKSTSLPSENCKNKIILLKIRR
ncbi:unnamed protein product [Meloidogyne enterolobii]|uniref:Uncharacterized protein n=1 Tax=Meloidogyne enterolobii TaxID=390850 RepID=A0ACB0ZDW9_MELEN